MVSCALTAALALLHGRAIAQGAAASATQAAWVELSPTGPIVRAITKAPTCPRAAAVDDPRAVPATWDTPMVVRADPNPPDFPNLVCEWQPMPTVRYVALEGHPTALRMPAPNPRRIVVFGDSGCLGGDDQDCQRDWYFADIARFAAARNPDLVIHTGDYNYRGTNCIAYDGCCTYNPINCGFPICGDSWANWRGDFFAPAAPLLAAAPWVMGRGNHELCGRAGAGWFRYLDPHSPPPACAANPVVTPTYTQPYPLYLGDLRLIVFDSASACGQADLRDEIPVYRAEFERVAAHVAAGTSPQTWLVSHKPLWGILEDSPARRVLLNYTLQQASANRLPAPIGLVLSGHEHLFQSLTLAEVDLPPTLMVGTGGAELDDPERIPTSVENVTFPGGPTVTSGFTIHDHGYLVIDRSANAWTATFYDRYDRPLATCASDARPSLCRAVAQ